MTRAPSLHISLACLCGIVLLPSCGDSGDGKPDPGGTGTNSIQPPLQKAIYLRSRNARPPGTSFSNSATLTMADAKLITRRGDDSVNGKVTTIMRDVWDVTQVSPTERSFTIEEMSLTNISTIEGKVKNDRSESTLAGLPLKVTRNSESAPWVLSPPEQKLTHLQEIDLRMLGKLWAEGSNDLYPEESLEIGQSWKADPKAFGMIVSPRLKVEHGEVTCRLDEITVLRNQRCGAVNIDIDITGTFEMGGGAGMQVQIALTGTIMRSLYKNFDMRTELKGSMQMEMEFPDQDRTISIDGVAEFFQIADMREPEEDE
jgi:hypothetical protein